jgi:hypothetical protein
MTTGQHQSSHAMSERKRLMSYESDLETGGTCITRKQDLWRLEIAMEHGPEKRLVGRKVITGRTRLM